MQAAYLNQSSSPFTAQGSHSRASASAKLADYVAIPVPYDSKAKPQQRMTQRATVSWAKSMLSFMLKQGIRFLQNIQQRILRDSD